MTHMQELEVIATFKKDVDEASKKYGMVSNLINEVKQLRCENKNLKARLEILAQIKTHEAHT
jgi:hypothetical protein